MASRLIWSPYSLECIDKISEYIAMSSITYAKAFARRIFGFGEHIVLFPEFGRIVPEYANKFIREIIYGNYRIVYRIDADIVNVLSISNSAQLLIIPNLTI